MTAAATALRTSSSFMVEYLALVFGAAGVAIAVTVGVALYSQRRVVNRLRGVIAQQRGEQG